VGRVAKDNSESNLAATPAARGRITELPALRPRFSYTALRLG